MFKRMKHSAGPLRASPCTQASEFELSRKKDELQHTYIAKLKYKAQRTFREVVEVIEKTTNTSCLEIPVLCWDQLRNAFLGCLIVFELRRRFCYYLRTPLVGHYELRELLKATLDVEAKFGGVTDEQLIRVFRIVYPDEAKQFLPHTAFDMWKVQVASQVDKSFSTSPSCGSVDNATKNWESAFGSNVSFDYSQSSGDPSTFMPLSEVITGFIRNPSLLEVSLGRDLQSFPFVAFMNSLVGLG